MRFFDPGAKIGRFEYVLFQVISYSIVFVSTRYVLDLRVDLSTLGTDVDAIDYRYSRNSLAMFTLIALGGYALSLITTIRRLLTVQWSAHVAFLHFLPPLAQLLHIILALRPTGGRVPARSPYGDDPYDPQSWMDPERHDATLTYQGSPLHLDERPGSEQPQG